MNNEEKAKRKYTGLVISVVAFLLLNVVIFSVTSFISRKAEINQERINTSLQTRDSLQTISRVLSDLKLNEDEGPFTAYANEITTQLQENTQFINQAMAAFKDGGQAIFKDRHLTVSATKNQEELDLINEINIEWQEIKPVLEEFLDNTQNLTSRDHALNVAIATMQSTLPMMLNSVNGLVQTIHSKTQKMSAILKTVQFSGIAVTVFYFLIFIFFFIRRLRLSDRQIEEARRETTEIMDTIQEGLFLIDEDLRIGQQTSRQLADIVPDQTFSGKQLEDVLDELVETKDIENTRRFIKQLFNERIDEYLIADLNPLQKVKIRQHQLEQNSLNERYVRFIFTRVWKDDAIDRILVSVTDITASVRLEQRLARERVQNEQQLQMLMKILHIAPPLLASFLRNAEQLTQRVNNVLQRSDRNPQDLKNKAKEIYRDIHSFKGESSALHLDHFVDVCELIEDRLKQVIDKNQPTGNDFLKVTIALDELIDHIHSLSNLQQNIQQISVQGTLQDEKQGIKDFYNQLTKDVAERNGKDVELNIQRYDIQNMDTQTHDQVKEILIQLIRNAVVHGVETTADRLAAAKDMTGHIAISLSDEGDEYRLRFGDDGGGIDYATLRICAKQHPSYSHDPAVIDHMSDEEMNRFIFTSGLTTVKNSNSDAGRGVGMSVVKEKLQALHGRVAIRSNGKLGTQFTIRFPKPKVR